MSSAPDATQRKPTEPVQAAAAAAPASAAAAGKASPAHAHLKPATTAPEPQPGTFAALAAQLSGYMGEADLERVRRAYRFADAAHLGQMRGSGEPYITHPIAVAGLCAAWRLDAPAIMAALMHDTMEDQGVSKNELISEFGAPVAELVDGLSKLDKLKFQSKEEGQAESFRKMLLAMSRDVRVVLVKLCDRLHNMRTLDGLKAAKRQRIARETLEIYAQIAHRLGLNETYRELQDLSFRHLYPHRYTILSRALRTARGHRKELVKRIDAAVRHGFAAHGLPVQIMSREKTLFSIYRKMASKRLSFSQVLDVQGFRLVVDDLMQCYTALGVIHQLYKPLPGNFKDYIAIPKSNGYQSLHTTVQGPYGDPVEFQIRTQTMHAMAESGIAAHWLYKANGEEEENAQTAATAMLQSLLEVAGESQDPNDFFEHVKLGLATDSVYVFTPAGKIVDLPRGSTVVDFAYYIHRDVGHTCVGAKVDNIPVPLNSKLYSGKVVHIETLETARPNPEWLSFVTTARARSAIRHYLRNSDAAGVQQLGETLLSTALDQAGLPLASLRAEDWEHLLKLTGEASRERLLNDLGLGLRSAQAVASGLVAAHLGDDSALGTLTSPQRLAALRVDGSETASVRYATCCHPIPGDGVFGYLGKGEGLEVHRVECPQAIRQYQRNTQAWIDVRWADTLARSFETAILARVNNSKGVLARVSTAISGADSDILHMSMSESRALPTTDLRFLVSVRDKEHLDEVLKRVAGVAHVVQAWREEHH